VVHVVSQETKTRQSDAQPGADRRGLTRRRFLGAAGATGAAGIVGPSILDVIDAETAGAATPVSGGTLTWRLSSEATTLDPAGNTLSTGTPTSPAIVAQCLFDALGTYNYKTTSFLPRTAMSISPNSAQTQWTIKLHTGINFTDGTPYDANAINFHWNRIANPATASLSASLITGWTWAVVDAQTFQVTLPEPLGNFLESMGGPLGAIPSPTAVTKYGSLFGTSPSTTVGAGPFTLQSWVHGTSMTLNKNATYWQSGKPYLNQLVFNTVSDNPTTVNGMLTEEFQLAYFSASDASVIPLQQAKYPVAQLESVTAYGLIYQFAATGAPFNDVRMRQALILATNPVDANLKSTAGASPIAGGTGTAFYPKSSVFFNASVNQKMNNLAAAQKLVNNYVAEKGAFSAPIQLTCPSVGYLVNLGTALQQQFAKLTSVTIQLNVTATAAAAILAYSKGQFTVAITLDPAWYFVQDAYAGLFSTSPANVTHYSNPKFDALVTAGRGYQDIPHRKTYMNQMGQTLFTDSAYGRIFFAVFSNFAQKTVGNLNTSSNWGGANWPDPALLYVSASS
jgi:peptide/nickel transport system substrate-binding protein